MTVSAVVIDKWIIIKKKKILQTMPTSLAVVAITITKWLKVSFGLQHFFWCNIVEGKHCFFGTPENCAYGG